MTKQRLKDPVFDILSVISSLNEFMESDTLLATLAQKVQDGTATEEEQIQFAKNLNHSAKLYLRFIDEVKNLQADT